MDYKEQARLAFAKNELEQHQNRINQEMLKRGLDESNITLNDRLSIIQEISDEDRASRMALTGRTDEENIKYLNTIRPDLVEKHFKIDKDGNVLHKDTNMPINSTIYDYYNKNKEKQGQVEGNITSGSISETTTSNVAVPTSDGVNITVKMDSLSEVATNIKNKKQDINSDYNDRLVSVLNSCRQYLDVSGINYDAFISSFNNVFTSLDSQLSELVDVLQNKVIPSYNESSQVINQMFNTEFANQMNQIISVMNQ